MGASVAAAIVAREKRIVERFREAGATSSTSARTSSEIGIHEGIAFRRLRHHEVIRDAGSRNFYLDEAVWLAVRRTRRRFLLAIFVVILIVALGAALGFMSTK